MLAHQSGWNYDLLEPPGTWQSEEDVCVELISEVHTWQGSARQFTRPLAPQKPDLVERKHIRVRKARGQADRMIQTAKFCFYLLQIHRIMK